MGASMISYLVSGRLMEGVADLRVKESLSGCDKLLL